jgi:hypothetical protein
LCRREGGRCDHSDPEAAIFSSAHFGVVASFEEIVPPLTESLPKTFCSDGTLRRRRTECEPLG